MAIPDALTADLSDVELAAALATAAGDLLNSVRAESGLSGRELGDAGDRQSDDFLQELLARLRPDDSVLSEESADDLSRLDASRVWIVDPVDGTREYGSGRVDWAVHVALWERGDGGAGLLTAGAVALPALGVTYSSDAAPIEPVAGLAAPRTGRDRVVVSGSRPPGFADVVAAAVDAELTPMGSAGAKAMAVVRGEADAYIHGGGQYEWDSAAPVAVAQAKGLWCSRIDGSPLRYNQRDTFLPDLIVCRPDLADRIIAAIQA
ncbi:3'(2'),5'-bisphosphate nucleotidase CysQ [uncultured Gordonia sp.]|uniref:3'(2'),5'-bisphosphate nucleotidase CysQ n=3 Tax=Gordonia sp. (in: high G+C Gram-positive bacteria) TaxID=84139 RepID=UPI000FAD63BE|nr:3'(2'),5'-bisphosphate nucleotidase CysQ [uncultured Gordonia sp.]RUP41726.1 MAG: 3'(2'),5'-bisphosphate nucleotidase CysQ [Gordonia sp. (in: high G+C Gram-positive bacteria)]